MSSNRRGGEESILSMLERDSGRSRRHSAGRLTLYAATGLVLLGLVSTIAWLAREQSGSQQVEQVLSARPAPAVAMAEDSAVPADAHAEGAAIIDSREPPPLGARAPATAQAAHEAPPLVLVPPDEARPAPAAAPAVREPVPATLALTAPSKAPRSAAPRPRATAKAASAGKSQVAVRRQPPAKKAKPAPTRDGVDTDVALISAIISHAGKRPAESEAGSSQQ